MEKKGFKWQMAVGAVFMFVLVLALFMPAMKISGEHYLKAVVDINKHAKDEDSNTASEAKVDKNVIDKYKENTSAWDKKADEFDDEIEKKDKGSSISELKLAKWLLTADKEIDDIEGIEKTVEKSDKKTTAKAAKTTNKKASVKNKKSAKKTNGKAADSKKSKKADSAKTTEKTKKLQDSDVSSSFRIMGIMLLLPVILAIAGIILMLVTRKTNQIFMIVSGGVSVLSFIIWKFIMPGMIWDKIEDYVKSITLVDAKVLAIKNMGRYTVSRLMSECTGIGFYVTAVAGVLLIVAGILFMTALKPVQDSQNEDNEWDFGVTSRQLNEDYNVADFQNSIDSVQSYDNVLKTGENNSNANDLQDFTVDISSAGKGKLLGVEGQYKGFEVEINPGEEIIFGRDPASATLVFENSKVSRKHCGVIFDGVSGKYRVIDYSSNGIEFSNGMQAKVGEYVAVNAGTVIYLAGRREAVKLG